MCAAIAASAILGVVVANWKAKCDKSFPGNFKRFSVEITMHALVDIYGFNSMKVPIIFYVAPHNCLRNSALLPHTPTKWNVMIYSRCPGPLCAWCAKWYRYILSQVFYVVVYFICFVQMSAAYWQSVDVWGHGIWLNMVRNIQIHVCVFRAVCYIFSLRRLCTPRVFLCYSLPGSDHSFTVSISNNCHFFEHPEAKRSNVRSVGKAVVQLLTEYVMLLCGAAFRGYIEFRQTEENTKIFFLFTTDYNLSDDLCENKDLQSAQITSRSKTFRIS